jgi:hypothetical protein
VAGRGVFDGAAAAALTAAVHAFSAEASAEGVLRGMDGGCIWAGDERESTGVM